MVKVVINKCYGGYSLSDMACALLRFRGYDYDDFTMSYKVPRHNKDLVEVVEKLGSLAGGEVAALEVVELEEGCTEYRIEEYDGMEQVVTRDSEDWIKID